ncbi:hypothetical protein PGIGA_G00239080 [Pangasianodon gigas]|uniref:Uncharacterized protein n=1 Tax=Pangasianodon gigas TaxID=30993 RepID=A0ACC5WMU9_PANGG|nr:hypothetical protein [Pangasianodon gigas]
MVFNSAMFVCVLNGGRCACAEPVHMAALALCDPDAVFSRSASCFSGCCCQIKGVRLLKIRAYTHKIHTEPFLKTMPSAQ